VTKNSISKQLCNLIIAYWTPERIELWHKYEKTDQSIPWREYEHTHRKENHDQI
jgi:hypothetical protein